LDRILCESDRHPLKRASRLLLLQIGPSLGHASLVRAEIGHDPQQPSGELRLVSIPREVLIRPDKCFLNHVLRIIPTSDHLVRKSVHEKSVTFEKILKRFVLTSPRTRDQRFIGF
jgi:hypothetical protein